MRLRESVEITLAVALPLVSTGCVEGIPQHAATAEATKPAVLTLKTPTSVEQAYEATVVPVRTPTPDVAATVKAYTPDHSSANQDVLQYYPELEGKEIKKIDFIKTPETSTTLVNMTNIPVDLEAYKRMITYFEDVAKRGPVYEYLDRGSSYTLAVAKPERKSRLVYLASAGDPPPFWADQKGPGSFGATTKIFGSSYVTVLRLPPEQNSPSKAFPTPEDLSNKLLTVETCQSTTDTFWLGYDPGEEPFEIFCNSAVVYNIKQRGFPYESYKNWAKDALISRGQGYAYHPLLVISEEEYNSIPLIGLPISLP